MKYILCIKGMHKRDQSLGQLPFQSFECDHVIFIPYKIEANQTKPNKANRSKICAHTHKWQMLGWKWKCWRWGGE